MSYQIELRAEITDKLLELLCDYFLETESVNWGVIQGQIQDPYYVFGIFPDSIAANEALKILRSEFPNLPNKFVETKVKTADWQNAYKQYIKP